MKVYETHKNQTGGGKSKGGKQGLDSEISGKVTSRDRWTTFYKSDHQ